MTGFSNELRQTQTQTLKLSLQQRQSLHLLQLSLPDLRAELYEELSHNPVIEEIEPTLEKVTTSQKEREAESRELDHMSDYTEDDDIPDTIYTADADALDRRQKFFESQTSEESLEEHLLAQLPLSDIDKKDYAVAEMVIGDLDDDGYFRGSIPDIMMVSGEGKEKILSVIKKVTLLDPPGCAAMSLEECLLAQIDKLDNSPYQQEVREILEGKYLSSIAEGKFASVLHALGMTHERYADVLGVLRTLEPRPGRAYARRGKSVAYVNPEIKAFKVDDKWIARVDDRNIPEIKISKRYIKMLQDPSLNEEAKAYVRERIAAAESIKDAVERRQETIESIAQSILDAQPDFFDKGLKGLHPLTMQEVADKVGVHPATVSRTVHDKYISTPKGVVELRKFFTQGLTSESGETIAKNDVFEKLKNLIKKEDKMHPLSDDKISELLKRDGFPVARRTVAKYRMALQIPGANDRRKN